MEETGTFSVGKGVLLPLDDLARTLVGKLKVGDRVLVKVHRPRNPDHHRLAFAVLQRIAAAKGESVETVLTWLKVALGRVDFVLMPSGKSVACPRSISFSSMSQDEFQRFWNEALRLIFEHIMPGLPEPEYEELRAMIAGDAARAEDDQRGE